jgi:hypothetical protein
MIRNVVSIDETIALLNELLSADPEAIRDLLNARVVCNDDVANHPTVQVLCQKNLCSVSFLGILNGLFGTHEDGFGPICAVMEKDGSISSFRRTKE